MKNALFVLAIAFGSMALNAGAQAQNYPWCAYYGGAMSGSSNCGFSTLQQCMANVSGIGGSCVRNNLYVAPNVRHPRRRTDNLIYGDSADDCQSSG